MRIQPVRNLRRIMTIVAMAAAGTLGAGFAAASVHAATMPPIPTQLNSVQVSVVAWPCLNVRTGPSTADPATRCAAHGTRFTIDCQSMGSFNGGDRVWDRIQGTKLFVSDWWVSNTGWGVPLAGLSNC